MTQENARRPSKKERPAAHFEVVNVLHAALEPITKLFFEVAPTEEGLRKRCALVVDWRDRIGRAFFESNTGEVPTAVADVLTFDAEFEQVMDLATEWYRSERHVEPALRPGEIRAIVLTLGTLTVFRLERDDTPVQWNPVHASDSYGTKQSDVMLLAVAAWRADQPEGFLLKSVFKTRAEGEAVGSHFERHTLAIARSSPTPAALEAELRRIKLTYGTKPPPERFARVYAIVAWLQATRALIHDVHNGAEILWGGELELQNASALASELGDELVDLN